jgi:hypothetical protein
MDASDRTRRIRSRVEFQAKASGMNKTPFSQSSEFATGAEYGAIVSNENGCCDTNYSAYFTVTELGRSLSPKFDILAGSPFTIEWWQTEATVNGAPGKPRPIFSFGTCCSTGDPEFGCVFEDGSILTRIAGFNFPEFPNAIPYGDENDFQSLLTPNHFAMVRGAEAADNPNNIRIYRNGGFLGEFTYPGAISITNQGDKLLTIRNQTDASEVAEMYGTIHSFRWTAESLYYTETYYINQPPFFVPGFTPPPLHMTPNSTDNVLTITRFPTAGSIINDGCTITRYDSADL